MTDNEIRGILLRKYYDRRREGMIGLEAADFDGRMSDIDIKHVSVQLMENGLIEGKKIEALSEGLIAVMAKITAMGIDVVEEKTASPISLTINNDSSISVANSSSVIVGSGNAAHTNAALAVSPAATSPTDCEDAIKLAREEIEREYLLVHKKTIGQFILDEFLAYVAQFLVALLGIVVATGLLRDMGELEKLANARISDGQFIELSLTVLGVFLLVGVGYTFGKDSKFGMRFINEFVLEIPRAIYFFGSGISALIAAIFIHLRLHPQSADSSFQAIFAWGAFMVAFFGFFYGCGFNMFLRWRQIKK